MTKISLYLPHGLMGRMRILLLVPPFHWPCEVVLFARTEGELTTFSTLIESLFSLFSCIYLKVFSVLQSPLSPPLRYRNGVFLSILYIFISSQRSSNTCQMTMSLE